MGRTRIDHEHRLRDQLERMAHRSATIGRIIADYAAPLDPHGSLLMRLIERYGPVRSSDLAERSGLSRPSVSRCVAALEQAGLVCAEHDPHDGRASLVHITADGRRQLERMAAVAHERISEITQDFSAAEIESLGRLLARLNDNADDIAVVPARYRFEKATS